MTQQLRTRDPSQPRDLRAPPHSDLLDEMVRRIVQIARPRKIILFGSAARGEMRPDSDLDLLVIMPDGSHRRHTAQRLCRGLAGLGVAKDVVVATEADVRDYDHNPSLVLCSAVREGKELYHAAG